MIVEEAPTVETGTEDAHEADGAERDAAGLAPGWLLGTVTNRVTVMPSRNCTMSIASTKPRVRRKAASLIGVLPHERSRLNRARFR